MAATDQVKIQRVYTNPADSTTSLGVEEKLTMVQFQGAMTVGAAAGAQGAVIRTAAPADSGGPAFADLTAAYTAWKAMRTALIAAGVFI